MKKILFFLLLLFGIVNIVFADSIVIYDVVSGDIDPDVIYTSDDHINPIGYGSFYFTLVVAYYDINGELLESFYADRANLSNDYEFIRIGQSCNSYYSSNNEYCDKAMKGVYFSGKNIEDIKYWKLVYSAADDFYSEYTGRDAVSDFCISNAEIKETYLCSSYINTSYSQYGNAILKFVEYNPVSFELVCEPEEVKKGENASCKLKAKAEDDIVEVTINPNSEIYEVVDYKETEGWTSVKNEDGTITLINEEGFKGEDFIVSVDLKFKESILNDVVVELTDISYTTGSGATMKSTVNDNINIYEEPEEEIKEEIEKNPETVGFTPVGALIILLLSLILLIVYRKRIDEGM